ncbi:MAG: hypothetical protein R3Y08_08335 [Rikenellaceae bacterium]
MTNNICPCNCAACTLQPEQHKERCALFMTVKQNAVIIDKLNEQQSTNNTVEESFNENINFDDTFAENETTQDFE